MGKTRKLITVAILLAVVPGGVAAQVPVDSATKKSQDSLKRAVAPDTTGGSQALFTRNDLLFTGGLLAGTAVISLLDKPVAQNLGDSTKIPGGFRKGADQANPGVK